MPAFGAFLRCDCDQAHDAVILLNVFACMSPQTVDEFGEAVQMTREDRLRAVITTLMHEFGHALEQHFKLPVNEAALEKATEEWEQRAADFAPTIAFKDEKLIDGGPVGALPPPPSCQKPLPSLED